MGGDAQDALNVIREGDWRAYFTEDAPLSTARPLSYIFKDLSGRTAGVSEATDFSIRDCNPLPPSGESFQFLLPQQSTPGIGIPFETLIGDFDGDGRDDLLANFRDASANEFQVSLSNGDGTFSEQASQAHGETPTEGWTNYEVLVGDVDNDMVDDIVWTYTGAANNTYVALSNGDGTFDFLAVTVHPEVAWGTDYEAEIGDVDGVMGDDLIWYERGQATTSTFVALSDGAGGFTYLAEQVLDFPLLDNSATNLLAIGNMNGDPRADIVVNGVNSSGNGIYVGLGQPDGTFAMEPTVADGRNWTGARAHLADIDGNGTDDLVFDNPTDPGAFYLRIYPALNDGNGTLTIGPFQDVPASQLDDESDPMGTLLADVDGNGSKDLVWTTSSSANRIYVGLGGDANGLFTYSRLNQAHPDSGSDDWQTYRKLVGDINGDRRDDIIWTNEASSNRVYVGLAIVR